MQLKVLQCNPREASNVTSAFIGEASNATLTIRRGEEAIGKDSESSGSADRDRQAVCHSARVGGSLPYFTAPDVNFGLALTRGTG